jgi:hypothetical protein
MLPSVHSRSARLATRSASVSEVPASPIPFRPRGFAPPRRFAPLWSRRLVASCCRSWGSSRFVRRPPSTEVLGVWAAVPAVPLYPPKNSPRLQPYRVTAACFPPGVLRRSGRLRFQIAASPPGLLSTGESVALHRRCQRWAPSPSMGFVPLQGLPSANAGLPRPAFVTSNSSIREIDGSMPAPFHPDCRRSGGPGDSVRPVTIFRGSTRQLTRACLTSPE